MSIKEYQGKVNALTDTPFGYTLSLIGTITYRTLSAQLKEMEADGLIIRREYPQIPPKVEYSLSDKGRSLLPVMEAMCEWGSRHSE